MRRVPRLLLLAVLLLLALPPAALVALRVAVDSDWGAARIARLIDAASGGRVAIDGLGGDPLGRLRVARLSLSDAQGVWLEIAQLELAWSPRALLQRRLVLDEVAVARVRVLRAPHAQTGTTAGESGPAPDIALGALRVARLEFGPGLADAPALALAADASWSPRARALRLEARDLARDADRIALSATQDDAGIAGTLDLQLGAASWLAARLGIDAAPPLGARVRLDGRPDAARIDLAAEAGPARLTLDGVLDLPARRGALRLAAASATMRPHPQLGWSALHLDATISGRLEAPLLRGAARIEDLRAGPLASPSVELTSDGRVEATATRLSLGAMFAAPRVDGAPATLMAGGPLAVALDLLLDDDAQRIERLRMSHPLATLQGDASLRAGRIDARLDARVASLHAPLAAAGLPMAGLAVGGAARLQAKIDGPVAAPVVALALDLDGLSTGTPLDAALGPTPRVEATLLPEPGRLGVPGLFVAGAALDLAGSGTLDAGGLAAELDLRLPRIETLVPEIAGALRATARIDGPLAAPAARIELAGDALRRGPVALERLRAGLSLARVADGATASLDLSAGLAGMPVAVQAAGRLQDTAWTLMLERVAVAGLSASGEAHGIGTHPAAARLAIAARDLAPLGRALGTELGGAVDAVIDMQGAGDDPQARATLRLDGLTLPGTRVRRVDLDAALTGDPARRHVARIALGAAGIAIGGQEIALDADAQGPLGALRTRIAAKADGWRVTTRATIAALGPPRVRLDEAELAHDDLTLRLRQPATLAWQEGLVIDGLRAGIGGGSLAIDGRVGAAASDLRVAASRLPLDLLARIDPRLAGEGHLDAEARLTGPIADPAGRVALTASGLRAADGVARGLPPATLRLAATRARGPVAIEAEATLGATSRLTLSGSVPTDMSGRLALRAAGRIDLAASDPFLAPAGRRARGIATLDATIGGTLGRPSPAGSLALADGLFEDALSGLRLDRVSGRARIQGLGLGDIALRARAGAGEIAVSGSANADPAAPEGLDLAIVLASAQLLRSRLAEVALDGTLRLAGHLPAALRLSGAISVPRAEFRVAESMPPGLPVLAAREIGPAPPRTRRAASTRGDRAAPLGLDLDLAVTIPDTIFVRGRGIDAQLGGALKIMGDVAAPQLRGEAALRRGSFELLSQRLEFVHGRVVFDGGAPADPALDFEARREAKGITAIVGVSGRPSAPVLALRSEPELPADEILARLLFGRNVAEASPLELAQIAQGIAALFGGDAGGSVVDALRRGLGLDQLRLSSSREGEGMGVEAGRMLAPGIYLGVRPGRLPSSYEATLQIEIAPRLRLETDLGAAGRAGIAYEIDW